MPKKSKLEENISSETIKEQKKKKSRSKTQKELEQQSTANESDKLIKLKEKLREKAKKLESEIKVDEGDLRKKVKIEEEKKDMLVPIEDYLKSSIHLGTRAITPDMRQYVYKRRADSLAVFNTTLLDEKIREAADYLTRFSPNEILVVCKREAGIHAVELFSKATGIRVFTKNYPAGIMTNPDLKNFLEVELLVICDPWTDKAAFDDARRVGIRVMAICDTNNYTIGVDKIVPGNNKSAKSLGMIFYLLTKIYIEKHNLPSQPPAVQDFVENWDTLQPPK